MTPAPANRLEAAWPPLDSAVANLPADIVTLAREALDREPGKPSADAHDAGHIARDSAARLAICGAEHEQLVRAVVEPGATEVVVVSGAEPNGLAHLVGESGPLRLAEVSVDPDAITNVYYTSGTTGPPKGCMVAHDYWIRFVELYLGLYGLDPDDRLLCCLEFFYNDPPWLFLTSLHAGAPARRW